MSTESVIADSPGMATPRRGPMTGLFASWPVIVAAYFVAYIASDWATYIHPFAGFDITPWNPPPAFSFALVLLFGRRFLPAIFPALLAADAIVRGWPLPTALHVGCNALVAATYAVTLLGLTSPRLNFDPSLGTLRDLVILCLVAVASSFVASCGFVAPLVLTGDIAESDVVVACLRYWIGDATGIVGAAPLLLIIGTKRLPRLNLAEDGLSALGIVVVVAIMLSAQERLQIQLFYLTFIPIIWISLNSGFERITLAVVVLQIVLVAGLEYSQKSAETVTAFQIRLFVLAMTGLLTGAVVSERRRVELQLRQHKEALERVSRIGSLGALGAVIAHEINQPLSAIAMYVDVVKRELGRLDAQSNIAYEAAQKAGLQTERAGEIVKRMRELVRLGRANIERSSIQKICSETEELLQDDLERQGISLHVRMASNLPPVLADRIQIQQVLINLVQNAIDAIASAPHSAREIVLDVRRQEADSVLISVEDEGPGFAPQLNTADILSIETTKASGTGLGLMISRTIVDNHGGGLWIDRNARGGAVRFTLKVVQ